MKWRILMAMLSVTAVAVALFGIPLAVVVQRFVDDDAALRVERQAVLASREVPVDFATGDDPVELPSGTGGVALALYDGRGVLVAGAGPATADEVTRRALGNRIADVEGAGTRVVAVPVAGDERVIGAIRAEQSTASSTARSRRILALLTALAGGVIAVGAVIGYLLAGRLALPVRRLRDAAVGLGEGDFRIEVPRSRVPELDQAASAMTTTARRLDDLVARERAFSTDASHQLRTPLAGLRAAIETELTFPRPDPTSVLHEAIADIDRLERTIDELLTLARTSELEPAALALDGVLAEVAQHWKRRFVQADRELVVSPARHLPDVRANAATLRHALDVLIDNALSHGAGTVRIEHGRSDATVTLSISDEGPGFAAGAGDGANRGVTPTGTVHGLGLPLARRLVDATPGRLTVARAGAHPRIDIVLQRAPAPTSTPTPMP